MKPDDRSDLRKLVWQLVGEGAASPGRLRAARLRRRRGKTRWGTGARGGREWGGQVVGELRSGPREAGNGRSVGGGTHVCRARPEAQVFVTQGHGRPQASR